ncbi:MAG: Maf-like protein [Thermoguttaceae bacterium]|nr:Maf-like protein [Thermoguttaceae bacterium]
MSDSKEFDPIEKRDASVQIDASRSFSPASDISPERIIDARHRAVQKSETAFRLVLGSRSPRRRQLLIEQGYRFAILPSEDGIEERAEETELRDAEPERFVDGLAFLKARNVVERLKKSEEEARKEFEPFFPKEERTPFVVVSCDSVAVCGGEILGKPRDRDDAERMLRRLSGTRHSVITGLCVWRVDPAGRVPSKTVRRVEISILQMEELSEERLASYLASGLWEGKAGAFGYQDGNDWLELVSGTASNVVGLPTEALALLLDEEF